MRSLAGAGRRLLLMSLALVLALTGPASAEPVDLRARLADQFVRVISFIMVAQVPTTQGLEASIVLAQEATELDPDNSERWYLLRSLALLGENREVYMEAVDRLSVLDPENDVIRLERINLSLERFQNAEDRIAAYERLLAPKFEASLGEAVRSRLAFDLALLHQRRGDIDAFARLLSEAVAIDPSNRTAAALAAGFFRMNVDDPFAEAELLANLVLASPTDFTSQIALSELLLDHGAYVGSSRLYRLAVENQERLEAYTTDKLLADYMIALWGAGRSVDALRVANRRQALLDKMAQDELRLEDPTLGPLERAETEALLDPILASARAVLHAFLDHEDAEVSLQRAMQSYDTFFSMIEEQVEDPSRQLASLQFEKTWIAMWLGRDPEYAQEQLTTLGELQEIPEQTAVLFEGWLAMMRGELDRSIGLLTPSDEIAGRFGLGVALDANGDRAGAARAFLEVARAQPGSLMGVWSARRLAELLDTRRPLSSDAERLEELIASIHPAFDRMTTSPTLGVELNIVPEQMVYQPYSPVMFTIEIQNNSPFPLAIGPEGPIRPQVLLNFSTLLARMSRDAALPPVVLDIDRRLRLEPHERLAVRFDLRRFKLGEVLETYGRMGTFLRVKASVNFEMSRSGALRPGLLGDEEWAERVRIEGVRVDGDWLGEAVASSVELEVVDGTLDELQYRQMFVLAEMLTIKLRDDAPPVHFQYIATAGEALTNAYRSSDAIGQAWLLSVIPPQSLPASLMRLVQASDERLVQIMYLTNHIEMANDPLLIRLLRTTDPSLRVVVDNIARQFIVPERAPTEQ